MFQSLLGQRTSFRREEADNRSGLKIDTPKQRFTEPQKHSLRSWHSGAGMITRKLVELGTH